MSQAHVAFVWTTAFLRRADWNKSVAPGVACLRVQHVLLLLLLRALPAAVCAPPKSIWPRALSLSSPPFLLPVKSVFLPGARKLRNGCFHFCAAAGGRLVSSSHCLQTGMAAGMDDPPRGAAISRMCLVPMFLAIPFHFQRSILTSSKSSSKFARPLAKSLCSPASPHCPKCLMIGCAHCSLPPLLIEDGTAA